MPAELIDPKIVGYAVTGLGCAAIALNRMGLLKVTFGRNGQNGNAGPHPISPEALSKITQMQKNLDEKFLTREKHEDVCMIACLEMRDYISKQMKEHTIQVIAAVKANGMNK